MRKCNNCNNIAKLDMEYCGSCQRDIDDENGKEEKSKEICAEIRAATTLQELSEAMIKALNLDG